LRELSKISGVSRSAIGEWLAGTSIPRSWDDGAMLVVDAIIKLAARYGKSFPDEDAVRQRCMDAYHCARKAQQSNGAASFCAPIRGIDDVVSSKETASQGAADAGSVPAGSGPESRATASFMGRWGAHRIISGAVVSAVLTVIAVLILLWWPAGRRGPAPVPNSPPVGIHLQPTPLRSAKSEKCVTVGGNADEARAFQFGCADAPGRTWYLQPVVGDGTIEHLFRIVNSSNDKCLSYSDEFFGGAHVVVQRSCASGSDQGQVWSFVFEPDRGDGWIYGRLANMRSSQCLDINGESVDDGTPVIQWYCGEKLNQLFKVMREPPASR
ncbi:MAG: RICIN domain-containing protein, partial [Pseudonocardiaceae bacterium]